MKHLNSRFFKYIPILLILLSAILLWRVIFHVSFIATIDSIEGNRFIVTGSEINNLNHRHVRFRFDVDDRISLSSDDAPLTLQDFSVGQTIRVTYNAAYPRAETDPLSIHVIKVFLLEE